MGMDCNVGAALPPGCPLICSGMYDLFPDSPKSDKHCGVELILLVVLMVILRLLLVDGMELQDRNFPSARGEILKIACSKIHFWCLKKFDGAPLWTKFTLEGLNGTRGRQDKV